MRRWTSSPTYAGSLRPGRVSARSAGVPSCRGRAALAAFMVLLTAFSFMAAGCGDLDKEVNDYLDEAEKVVERLEETSGQLQSELAAPLEQQETVSETLVEFRKAINEGQEFIDRTDPPDPCRDFSFQLRRLLDSCRGLADKSTQFVDYENDLATVAVGFTGISDTLKELMDDNETPAGFTDLYDEVRGAYASFMTVLTPQIFKGINEEYGEFLYTIVEDFQEAARKVSLPADEDEEAQEAEEEEEEGEEGEETGDEEQDEEPRDSYQNRQLEKILGDIPEEWAEFSARYLTYLSALRDATGLSAKQAEVSDLLAQSKEQIASLREQYE